MYFMDAAMFKLLRLYLFFLLFLQENSTDRANDGLTIPLKPLTV